MFWREWIGQLKTFYPWDVLDNFRDLPAYLLDNLERHNLVVLRIKLHSNLRDYLFSQLRRLRINFRCLFRNGRWNIRHYEITYTMKNGNKIEALKCLKSELKVVSFGSNVDFITLIVKRRAYFRSLQFYEGSPLSSMLLFSILFFKLLESKRLL